MILCIGGETSFSLSDCETSFCHTTLYLYGTDILAIHMSLKQHSYFHKKALVIFQ